MDPKSRREKVTQKNSNGGGGWKSATIHPNNVKGGDRLLKIGGKDREVLQTVCFQGRNAGGENRGEGSTSPHQPSLGGEGGGHQQNSRGCGTKSLRLHQGAEGGGGRKAMIQKRL